MRRRLGLVAAVGALVLLLSACGVPTSGSPRALGKTDVPVLPPTSTTTATTPSSYLPFTVVWLNASNAPSPQVRVTPPQSDRLANALGTLLGGPTTGSQFFTAIPSQTRLLDVSPNPAGIPTAAAPVDPVVIDLSNEFTLSSGIDQVLAVEQIVFTLACNLTPPAKVSVSFEVEGSPLAVPVLSGSPVSRAVTPADYGFSAGDCGLA